MKKYRIMEERLKRDLDEVKKNVEQLDQETKKAIGINENVLELIKKCSFEQLQEINRK